MDIILLLLAKSLPDVSATESVIGQLTEMDPGATRRPRPSDLKKVKIEDRVFPVASFTFVVSLGCSDIGMIHKLRNVVDVLAIFDQRADERGPGAVRRNSFILADLSCPLSDNVTEGSVAELLFNDAAVGIFSGLKKKITLLDFATNHFHPGDIFVDIMSGCWMNRNLILLLSLSHINEKPNSFLYFKIRKLKISQLGLPHSRCEEQQNDRFMKWLGFLNHKIKKRFHFAIRKSLRFL